MRKWLGILGSLAALALPTTASVAQASVAAGSLPIERVSVNSAGMRVPQTQNMGFGRLAISADGRYVAFHSNGLLTPDATGGVNVYVRDRLLGTTELVSNGLSPSGQQSGNDLVGMSSDGRYVVFNSNEQFDPAGGSSGGVYRRDRVSGTTTLVTPRNAAGQRSIPFGGSSFLSQNGRFMAFFSPAFWWSPGLVGHSDVFVEDLSLDTTELVASSPDHNYVYPSISDDGRYVAYNNDESAPASVLDRTTSSIVASLSGGMTVSPDGSKASVTWRSSPTSSTQVGIADLATGAITNLTNASGSQFAFAGWTAGSWSADSRQFAFGANYPVSQDGAGGVNQIFVTNIQTGATFAAPVVAGMAPNGNSQGPAVSNGPVVAFSSTASNLVPDDGSGVSDTIPVDEIPAGQTTPREDVYVEGYVQLADASVTPGATVSTGTAVTSTNPYAVSVTSPNSGSVNISAASTTLSPAPSGYQLANGIAFTITAPPADPTTPLSLGFLVDASIAGQAGSALTMLRDGVAVADCTDTSGHAIPDPCVATRQLNPDGSLLLTVLTSHASLWQLVRRLALPPQITSTSLPASGTVVAVNTQTPTLSVGFTDSLAEAHTCVADWGDASTAYTLINQAATSGNCLLVHTYAVDGVYNVAVHVTAADGRQSSATSIQIVIYDPTAGFVTGGGWIQSPPGAYPANPALAGRASFGFVSKYAKGATIPSGSTDFQFQTAAFTFHSTAYAWLVVSGPKAQYKGTGTVNGAPGFQFMLTALDGGLLPNNPADAFRIKITDAGGGVVYDNVLGASADMAATPLTPLSGGQIIIHKS
jgi:hypothetical protein